MLANSPPTSSTPEESFSAVTDPIKKATKRLSTSSLTAILAESALSGFAPKPSETVVDDHPAKTHPNHQEIRTNGVGEVPKGPYGSSPLSSRRIHSHKEDSYIGLSPISSNTPTTTSTTITKILAIYTGGTIGMKKSSEGYQPVKGYLRKKLAQLSQFNDERHRRLYLRKAGVITDEDNEVTEQTKIDQWFSTPRSDDGCVALYQLLEFDPILDSSNMGYKDWVKIAQCVSDHYNEYDCVSDKFKCG